MDKRKLPNGGNRRVQALNDSDVPQLILRQSSLYSEYGAAEKKVGAVAAQLFG
ncbi:hypothetical protein [Dyella sp. 2YAF14]|jgi:hypothetical protein|uniref:hypothetical protein n=1 Tax=Dyella sp. 2YAF14 TaxID=3233025 RepID=UPI003F918180